MKNFSLPFLFAVCVIAAVLQPATSFAQSKKEKDSIKVVQMKELFESQHYTFKAQNVTPTGGKFRQLTSDYDLQISKTEIISQLPYFGRAYSASIGTNEGGIQFTSKDFEYTVKEKKKGGWDVTIKFKDTKDVSQMQLSIFDNGNSTLQVASTNRQSISYGGYITAPTPPKK